MSNSKTFSLKTNKRGFTLIELSIVLIIIGLLIVAVNSGTSLIRNAKLRSITNEAKQYQVAVNSFFMKFDKYPGDFAEPLGFTDSGADDNKSSIAGNNDNKIQWVNGENVNEGSNAWLQLIDAGVLKEDIRSNMVGSDMKGTTNMTLIPINHYPASAENSAGWIFNSSSEDTTNYVQIVKSFSSGYSGTPNENGINAPTITAAGGGASLNTTDSFSIDKKNDDGQRTTGDIREVVVGGTDCEKSGETEKYDLTNSSDNICSLAFKVTIN